jgi:hypothetical protein
MHCLNRDEFGTFLNEAGILGPAVEVGTAAGAFASVWLSTWQGRRLTLIDPWEPQSGDEYLDLFNVGAAGQSAHRAAVERLAEVDPRARVLQGFSPAIASEFADGSLDCVYLDANHAYLAVRDDLAAWYPKVRPGGLLSGHDYLDGVRAGCLFAVKTAVAEFAAQLGRAVAFTITDAPYRSWWLRKPLGARPSPDRVTMLTAYDDALAPLGEISRGNKAAYCGRHGYRFVCRTSGFDSERPSSWSKIRFVRAELDHADWVFWSDADSLVMNSALRLTDFIDDSVELVLSADPYHGINAGCFFVRNSSWARAFLDRVYARTEFLHHPWWENAALIALYEEDAEVRRHVAVVPNKLFNGYPYEGGNYEAGDFMIHLPGLANRAAALRNYAAMAR